MSTQKHQKLSGLAEIEPNRTEKSQKSQIFSCEYCKKNYASKSGLWSHKKKCQNKPLENTLVTNNAVDNKDIILELLKQNNEFKQMIIELAKEPKTINNTMTNSNNNNTNNFNLNFFLNTTCKDAITADQFVENIQITFDDLENVGNSGYVKGITDIIMKQLRTLELTERPFHCTDVKRETIYIKEADAWNKDNEEKTKMKTVIGKVARKNLCKIKEWCAEHPDVHVLDSKDYEMNHKIIRQSFGDGEDEKLQNDVVKNISKEVRVEKRTRQSRTDYVVNNPIYIFIIFIYYKNNIVCIYALGETGNEWDTEIIVT
jgi:hypothetical protein